MGFHGLVLKPKIPRRWALLPWGQGRGSISRLSGVLSQSGDCYQVESRGLHPELVCNAPSGYGIAKHGARASTRIAVRAWDCERGGSETRDVCERS